MLGDPALEAYCPGGRAAKMVVMSKKRVKKRLEPSAKECREHAINVARLARANPKKRGIQPGYIRTLELTLAWVFSNVNRCEDILKADLALEGGRARSIILGKSVEAAEEHKRWSKSTVCKQIDRLLSGADVEESPNLDWEDEYSSVQHPRRSSLNYLTHLKTSQDLFRSQCPRAV
ncbi:hypothetical protein LTR28_003632 [Elasticomyces elasticus]|nr:hypothetical protein LTR28_003632 [Elasticomyces elasticus]